MLTGDCWSQLDACLSSREPDISRMLWIQRFYIFCYLLYNTDILCPPICLCKTSSDWLSGWRQGHGRHCTAREVLGHGVPLM